MPDHGSPFDHFVSRPLRSGRAPRPGPDSDGQDATLTSPSPIRPGPVPGPDSDGPGPALALPVTPHGPAPRGTAGPTLPAPRGRPSQSQLWTCCSSTQQVQARSTGVPLRPVGCGSEPGPTSRSASPSSARLPRGTTSPSSYTRATRRGESSAGGEGLPQTTPLLSSRGCKWGPNPLSSMNTYQPEVLCSAPKPSRDTPEGGSSA